MKYFKQRKIKRLKQFLSLVMLYLRQRKIKRLEQLFKDRKMVVRKNKHELYISYEEELERDMTVYVNVKWQHMSVMHMKVDGYIPFVDMELIIDYVNALQ